MTKLLASILNIDNTLQRCDVKMYVNRIRPVDPFMLQSSVQFDFSYHSLVSIASSCSDDRKDVDEGNDITRPKHNETTFLRVIVQKRKSKGTLKVLPRDQLHGSLKVFFFSKFSSSVA
jgi:hypothetical protein